MDTVFAGLKSTLLQIVFSFNLIFKRNQFDKNQSD